MGIKRKTTKRNLTQQEKRNGPGGCNVNIWRVPVDVRQRFKSACAKQTLTMQEVLVDLMMLYPKERDLRREVEARARNRRTKKTGLRV